MHSNALVRKAAAMLMGGLITASAQLWAQNAVDESFWNDVLNDRRQAVMEQLAAGLDPNEKSQEGQPAVMWAIQNESWAVYDLLAQHKDFDPNITNDTNETPLMYLAILGELDRGKALAAQGAKINRLGWTPLHYAASKGQVPFAQWLLNEGAFIHAPAPDGTTPLMMAAYSGNKEMVDLMLDAGADLRAVNINHHTAADWAKSAKNNRIAQYLTKLQEQPAKDTIKEQAKSDKSVKEKKKESQSSGTGKYFDLGRFE